MNQQQELEIRHNLEEDERGRDRIRYDYTGGALRNNGILHLSIYPEPNKTVAAIIAGEVDYNKLPIEEDNEHWKGALFVEQQDVIERHVGQVALCEALNLKPRLREACVLYNSTLGPPVCREYKLVFTM